MDDQELDVAAFEQALERAKEPPATGVSALEPAGDWRDHLTPLPPIKYSKPSGVSGTRIPLGAHPWNRGARPGEGTGRKTNAFKELCQRLREGPELEAALRAALSDPESKGFNAALRVVTDYDADKPAARSEVDLGASGIVLLPAIKEEVLEGAPGEPTPG